MERSIVPEMDQPHHGQGSNSAASSAMNSSLSLDLRIPMPRREAGKCKHFVMRQYALDMREKDVNTSLPFASDGEKEQLLPQMVVPKYKCWYCMNGDGAISSEGNVDGVSGKDRNHQSAKGRNLFSKGKAAHNGIPKMMTVPSQEVNVRGLEPSIRGSMPPSQRLERTKKRNTRVQVKESQPLALPQINEIFGQGPMKRKDVETTRNGSDILAKFDTQANRTLDRSLNSYISSHKDGIDHAIVGRGVLSLLSAEENRTFHQNHKRRHNLYAGESSVSYKSTTSLFVEEPLNNVIYKSTRSNVEVSPLPSQTVTLVQNLDFSKFRKDGNQENSNVVVFPKSKEKVIMPWLQMEFPNTHSNSPPTNGNQVVGNHFNNGLVTNKSSSFFEACKASSVGVFSELGTIGNRNFQGNETGRAWSPLISDHMQFRDKFDQRGPPVSNDTGMYQPCMSGDKGKRSANLDQNGVFLFGKPLSSAYNKNGQTDLVEKELFPKSSFKSRSGESSSSFKLFGRVVDSRGGVDSTVFPKRKTISDPVGPLTLGPTSIMQGTVRSMNEEQLRTEICTKNVNPADFSSPHARNPFMINGAELKVGRRDHLNGNGRRKKRVKKTPPAFQK